MFLFYLYEMWACGRLPIRQCTVRCIMLDTRLADGCALQWPHSACCDVRFSLRCEAETQAPQAGSPFAAEEASRCYVSLCRNRTDGFVRETSALDLFLRFPLVCCVVSTASVMVRSRAAGRGDGYPVRRQRGWGGDRCPSKPYGDADGAATRQATYGKEVS